MNWKIEREDEKDFLDIYELVKVAFQTAKQADGDEHDYVNNLRKSDNYLSELAFTIKDNSKIVGHIMLTKTSLKRSNENFEVLLLSPVCTKLEYRNQGLASTLIRHSLTKAKENGYKAVFLVGNPEFYRKFGFKSITNFEIKSISDIPEMYTMGLELEEGFLGIKGGTISIC